MLVATCTRLYTRATSKETGALTCNNNNPINKYGVDLTWGNDLLTRLGKACTARRSKYRNDTRMIESHVTGVTE